ncbi:cytochrome P450 [Kutzneria sp. NPDC051319]|uniref:cytochrome P450 n=1 Tax=Kutzneria sp. NPDC051319 TaxID=3155047 RepID=UPI00341897C0
MEAAVAGDPLGLLGSLAAGGPGLTSLYIGPRLVHAVTAPELVRAVLIGDPRRYAGVVAERTRRLTDGDLASLVATVAERARQLPLSWRPGVELDVNAAMAGYEPVHRGQVDGQSTITLLMRRFFPAAEPLRGCLTAFVAATLAWMWHELASHPHAAARLHAEVDTVLAGRRVTASDLPNLRYTRRVVSEVLRLHPVLLVMRTVVKPVRLGGIPLSPGAELLLRPHSLHRDPAVYADPGTFDPDRWRADRCAHQPRGAFVPFECDDRGSFLWTEFTVTVATIAQRWQLLPTLGRVRPCVAVVERPDRLMMVPRQRGV